jgi:hypothetical protein
VQESEWRFQSAMNRSSGLQPRRALEKALCESWLPGGSHSCERTYMKSTSESLSHPETSNGRAAGGNCVVARRGGEQPEADLRSQTKVNSIRFTTTASLRVTGEACRMSGYRSGQHPSLNARDWVVVDGWGENAGKGSCGSVENCPGRNPRKRSRAEVRVAIVAMKRGNARGAKGGRKVERQMP